MTTPCPAKVSHQPVRSGNCWPVALLFVLSLTGAANADEAISLEISAGDAALDETIIRTALPASLSTHEHFSLTRVDTRQSIPVQIDRGGEQSQLVWIIHDRLDAGAVRRYRLSPAKEQSASSRVSVTDDGKRLLVKVGDKPVLAYNHSTVPSPDPDHPYYARSGYIHPVYNPSGKVITDDFNPDHAHQHGIMLAWRAMTFEKRSTNGWDQKAGLGKVKHATVDAFGGGPVFGFIRASLKHVDLTAPGGAKPALDETWDIKVYALDDAFLFDVASTQRCTSASPVSIDKMHYGGLMIRGHADWHTHRNYDYLTDEGRSKLDGNQSRPRWVDLFGPIEGALTGATIMDHPSNFRFPQPVRLHPKMPYFCFAPTSLGSFTIEPDKPYVSRYRFYIHDGPVDLKRANRLWNDYATPASAKLVAN